MKVFKKILLLLKIIFFISCKNPIEKKEVGNEFNSYKVKKELKDKIRLEKEVKDTLYFEIYDKNISGDYYSKSIHAERGFYIKKEKPESDLFLYKLNFKKGKIEFEDLTEFYDCGNGVLSLKNSTYKKMENGNYEIQINGEYAYESSFFIRGEYSLIINKKKELFFYPVEILEHRKERIFAD
ncbi:hypothetical protein [Tenacibaculum sp. SG-28]|uniref:hypothetical protein n=1 Tax=Tenacibaculum sp. SG-28 TaxID=754426 RepID=UPI000CF4406B|nr:hypothetical protein [Tenacibaculum sp. SG-28]PQJ20792.1 hypothetical protein BSU00_10975 [Tenacibaculum sp. SG-28]